MTKLVLKKALFNKSEDLEIGDDAQQLEKFRKLILDHLSTLDDDEPEEGSVVKKAFSKMILLLKGGLPVGTIHTYRNGKKYIKSPSGKWIPKYDSHTRGAKMAVSAIKRKIAAAPDAHTMMQIILENRDRFSDKNGQPLPFVQDLSKYIASEQDGRNQATQEKSSSKEKKDKKGQEDTHNSVEASKAVQPIGEDGGDQEKTHEKDNPDKFAREMYNNLAHDRHPKDKFLSDIKRGLKKFPDDALERIANERAEDIEHSKAELERIYQRSHGAPIKQKRKREALLEDYAIRLNEIENADTITEMVNAEIEHRGLKKMVPATEGPKKPEEDKLDKKKAGKAETDNLKKVAELKDRYGIEFHADIIKRISELDEKARPKAKEAYLKLLESASKADERAIQDIHKNIEDVLKKGKKLLRQVNNGAKLASGPIISTMYAMEAASTAKRVLEGISEAAKIKPAENEEINEKSDFERIQEKYKNAVFEEGDDDQIQVGKELISGKWKLVEADTPTASHDETSFHKTPGFPTTDDGATINDRDYGHDKEAQEIVMEIGSDYDGRAVSVDNPVIVTKDGIVISGNNRTMSSKIAARKGTDKGYIEALKRKAKKFGFTPEQVDRFKHPRVVFETAENKGYSTDQFAKFNKSSKKAMSPVEAAVKVSKTIKMDTVESIAGKMIDFETLGELYADRNIINEIFNTFQRDNIITSMDRPQYVVDGGITGAGKEFLETVLIGSVINESNIRGLNREGCKSIRQKLVRAITPLIENKGMDGYSVTKELNEAVDIAMQVAIQKDKFKSVDDYASQKNLFGIEDDPVSVELARKLEGTQKEFATFMQSMNGGLKYAANGEADIFLGNVESREDILARMLNLKKSINNVIDFFRNLRAGKGPRFIKKAVPIQGRNGETELSERWIQESIEGIAPYVEEAGVSNTGAKVVAVDFDGVINSYISGWKGPTETDAPVLSAAESLKTLYGRGYKIIIFSTRANTQEGIDTIREYLRKHTKNNELADTIEITDQKPIADMYIDDRAIPFNGDWEETLKRIEEFEPWADQDKTIREIKEWTKGEGKYAFLKADETGVEIALSDNLDEFKDFNHYGFFPGSRDIEKLEKEGIISWTGNDVWYYILQHGAWKYMDAELQAKIRQAVMSKSLTYSGYPLQGRAKVHGMDISIENKKGSTRSGTDKDGHEWHTFMHFDYGYIRGTVGKDKDHIDVYVGPNSESEIVYIVNQNDPVTGDFDEQKVMLGFNSEEDAKTAYLKQYDRPGFFGDIVKMNIETFKDKAFDPKNKGKKLMG
jgi:hypothetical protein